MTPKKDRLGKMRGLRSEMKIFVFPAFQKSWCEFSGLSSLGSFLLRFIILTLFLPELLKENIKIKIILSSQCWEGVRWWWGGLKEKGGGKRNGWDMGSKKTETFFFHFCLFINQTFINPLIDSNNKHIFPFMLPLSTFCCCFRKKSNFKSRTVFFEKEEMNNYHPHFFLWGA